MPINHDGITSPEVFAPLRAGDIEWFYLGWREKLDGNNILSSEWIVPDGWTIVDSAMDKYVKEDDDQVYIHVNSVLLTTHLSYKCGAIHNRITIDGGQIITRGFYVNTSA